MVGDLVKDRVGDAGLQALRPRRASLVVLAVVALATIGTSPGAPSLEARTGSELAIDGGGVVTRDLRIQITDTRPLTLTAAQLNVSLRTVGDLSYTHSDAIRITVEPIDDRSGVAPATAGASWGVFDLPLEDCADGCDLAYRLAFAAREHVGTGAVIRFEAAVRLTYDYSSGRPPDSAVRVTLDGGQVPPVGLAWVLGAAAAGLVGGTRLGRRYRRPTTLALAPAGVLAAVLFLAALWPLTGRAVTAGVVFSGVLLLAHFGMLAFGIRRWRAGQSWILGLAASSTFFLCGLGLAWIVASLAVLPRIEMALVVGLLGVITGTVLGQTWDRREVGLAGRTVQATAVVVSQGLLMAGLTYVSLVSFIRTGEYDTTPNPLGLVPLGAAAFVGWGALRWFAGSGALMFVVNLLFVAVGLLGSFLWFSAQASGMVAQPGIDPLDVMIVIEVLAALVGVFAARHPLDRQILALASVADVADAEPEPSA